MSESKPTILVIDDDKDLALLLRRNLERRGYGMLAATTAEAGIRTALERHPSLILLDVTLPGMDGFEAVQVLRRKTGVPILMVSGRTAAVDRVLGLKLGGDDYICKPFDVDELLARVERALKRHAGPRGGAWNGPLRAGALEVDLACHEVRLAGRPVELTPKEFELLQILIEADGKVVTREAFLRQLWGSDADMEIETRTVDQHVARLRRALKGEAGRIRTVQGYGYKWESNGDGRAA